MAVVSSPASGSVTAKQALSWPAISGGSMRRFCSSVPNTTPAWGPKTAPAVSSRHSTAEPARRGERRMQLVGKLPAAVLFQPIRVVELEAELADLVPNLLLLRT